MYRQVEVHVNSILLNITIPPRPEDPPQEELQEEPAAKPDEEVVPDLVPHHDLGSSNERVSDSEGGKEEAETGKEEAKTGKEEGETGKEEGEGKKEVPVEDTSVEKMNDDISELVENDPVKEQVKVKEGHVGSGVTEEEEEEVVVKETAPEEEVKQKTTKGIKITSKNEEEKGKKRGKRSRHFTIDYYRLL